MTRDIHFLIAAGLVVAFAFFLPSTGPAQPQDFPGASLNDTSALRQRLVDGRDPDEEEDDGTTLLMRAAEEGAFDAAALLVEFEADVNASNDEGITPLMMAVMSGDNRIVRLLVENGANCSASDPVYGKTALMLAVERGDSIGVRTILMTGKCDVNQRDKNGCSALLSSAYFDLPEISQILLLNGSEVEQGDLLNNTPLMVAAACGNARTVQRLLEHGAEPNARTEFSRRTVAGGFQTGPKTTHLTALMFAAISGHAPVVRLLLRHGARLDLVDEDLTNLGREGRTALDYSMENSNQLTTRILVAFGNGDMLPDETLDETGPPRDLELNRDPEVLESSSGLYYDALKTGIVHKATMNVWVDSLGVARMGHLVRSTGAPIDLGTLVAQCLQVIKAFRFSPGYIDSTPVDCWTRVDVNIKPMVVSIIRN